MIKTTSERKIFFSANSLKEQKIFVKPKRPSIKGQLVKRFKSPLRAVKALKKSRVLGLSKSKLRSLTSGKNRRLFYKFKNKKARFWEKKHYKYRWRLPSRFFNKFIRSFRGQREDSYFTLKESLKKYNNRSFKKRGLSTNPKRILAYPSARTLTLRKNIFKKFRKVPNILGRFSKRAKIFRQAFWYSGKRRI